MNPLFAQYSTGYPPAYPRTGGAPGYPYYGDPALPVAPASSFDWSNPFVWVLIAVAVLGVLIAFAVMRRKGVIETAVSKFGGAGAAAGVGGVFVYLLGKMKGTGILTKLANGQLGPLGMLALTTFGGPSMLAKLQEAAKKFLDTPVPQPLPPAQTLYASPAAPQVVYVPMPSPGVAPTAPAATPTAQTPVMVPMVPASAPVTPAA